MIPADNTLSYILQKGIHMTLFGSVGRTTTRRETFKDKPKRKTKDGPQDTPSTVLTGEHGRYQIKSGRLAGEYVARAFPKPPTNARGLIAEAKGASEEAAIAALRNAINARETRRIEDRRIDARTGSVVPSTKEYVEAIGQVALSHPQRAMLLALSRAGDDGLTDMQMADAAGYKSPASADRSFAAAGLLIANYLSVATAAGASEFDLEGASFLAFRGARRKAEDPGNRILHTEVREAVRSVL